MTNFGTVFTPAPVPGFLNPFSEAPSGPDAEPKVLFLPATEDRSEPPSVDTSELFLVLNGEPRSTVLNPVESFGSASVEVVLDE